MAVYFRQRHKARSIGSDFMSARDDYATAVSPLMCLRKISQSEDSSPVFAFFLVGLDRPPLRKVENGQLAKQVMSARSGGGAYLKMTRVNVAFDNLTEWFRLVLKTRDRRCAGKKSRSTPPPPRCFWYRPSTDVCFL